MKHEWLAEELRKIAHGCDVTGIRGSQHIRHAADLLDGTEPRVAYKDGGLHGMSGWYVVDSPEPRTLWGSYEAARTSVSKEPTR